MLRNYPQADNQHFVITRGGGKHHTPLPDYWEEVSCFRVQCPAHVKGWVTSLDMNPVGKEYQQNCVRYNYIRGHSGRSYEEKWEKNTVRFLFPAGQECFGTHRVPLERPPIFKVNKKPVEAQNFFDDFNETIHLLDRRQKEG